MEPDIILPSVSSLSKLSVSNTSKAGFGYNPSLGALSNQITLEGSSILLHKKTVSLTPTSGNSIYDKNINSKKANEISLSALSFLFCEIVSWSHRNSKGIQDLEVRLNGLGYEIGQKYLELVKLREGFKTSKRETKTIDMLQFIHGSFWKAVFGKTANELEKSQDIADEYMITDNVPLVSKFISIPKDYGNLNCAAFIAGIVEGALDSAGFYANVTAHSVPVDGFPLRTVFLIKFDPKVEVRSNLRY